MRTLETERHRRRRRSNARDGSASTCWSRKQTREGLRLNNPAGHLDPGESPQQAVVREALEETGARVHAGRAWSASTCRASTPSPAGDDVTYLRFAFGGTRRRAEPGRAARRRHRAHAVADARRDRAPAAARHRSPLVLRCVEDHLAGRRYPLDLLSPTRSVVRSGATMPGRSSRHGRCRMQAARRRRPVRRRRFGGRPPGC